MSDDLIAQLREEATHASAFAAEAALSDLGFAGRWANALKNAAKHLFAATDALAAKDAENARLKALLDEADRFADFIRVALNEGTWDDCIVMALQSYQRESAKLKGDDHACD